MRSEETDESFRLTDEDTVEAVVADYREQIAASNAILDSLDLRLAVYPTGNVAQNPGWVDRTVRLKGGTVR